MHGLGPHNINVNGQPTTVRKQLQELYSPIEEAKADICGLFMLQYMFDHKLLPAAEKSLYTTFLASSFRTLRFGVHEAHGKGMALQFNNLERAPSSGETLLVTGTWADPEFRTESTPPKRAAAPQ